MMCEQKIKNPNLLPKPESPIISQWYFNDYSLSNLKWEFIIIIKNIENDMFL